MTDDEQAEMAGLMKQPAFTRFLYRMIQHSGLMVEAFSATDSAGRTLEYREGRRSLGLQILREAAEALPVRDEPQAALSLTLIQVLREAAQPAPKEKPRGRRSRYDSDGDDDGSDG